MGGTFKGLAYLVVCILMAGCSQTAKLAGHPIDMMRPASGQGDAVSGSAAQAGSVCLLDLSAVVQQEAVSSQGAPSSKAPAVEVPETSYDFGRLSSENESVHEFSVRNVGEAVLNIKKVIPA